MVIDQEEWLVHWQEDIWGVTDQELGSLVVLFVAVPEFNGGTQE